MGLHCTIVFSIGTPEKKVYAKHGSMFVVVNYHVKRYKGGYVFVFCFLFFRFFISFRLSRCAAASNEIIARCSLMYTVDKEVRSAVRVCVCVSSAHAVCVCSAHANARSCVSVMCPPKSS